MAKQRYELTVDEVNRLIDASRIAVTTPVIYTPTPGQRVHEVKSWADHAYDRVMDVWRELGEKYGFRWETVSPTSESEFVILAEPSPPATGNTARILDSESL
jgi:hypothetical protein